MQIVTLQNKEIEAIKLSAQVLPYRGVSINGTFAMSIQKLYDNYSMSGDKKYLECALLQIQAYLELGFTYENKKELFDKVLRGLGTDRKEQFPKRSYAAKKVKLTKPQVKKMIRQWSSSVYHTMTIDSMVDDIIDKVRHKEKGTFYYHSNNNPALKKKQADDVYELLIQEDECFFHDINGHRYYEFEE